jgi:hypothetical protein
MDVNNLRFKITLYGFFVSPYTSEKLQMDDDNDLWITIDNQLKTSELLHEGVHFHKCKNCSRIFSHSNFNEKGKLCTTRSDNGICPDCS